MTASRRLTYNFALDRALEYCRALGKPLVILEALRCGYHWASARLHCFVLDGMFDNSAKAKRQGVRYYPYVEPSPGAGRGLLLALASHACAVVTDDFPCFFLPRMLAAAAKQLSVRLEAVDSNGLLPLRAANQAYSRAIDFRRFLQKVLPTHLPETPRADPLARATLPSPPNLPKFIESRWPPASPAILFGDRPVLKVLPIDASVLPADLRGGHQRALNGFRQFLRNKLSKYPEQRNEPELDASSGLSAHLHFGHISVHEAFALLVECERWRPDKLALISNGSREGWWNMSPAAEAFLDQLITWRELGFNFCAHRKDYDQFRSLPDWARRTLNEHSGDKRAHLYSTEEFEAAQTHDPLWNAAQNQIVREGRMHNYMRMLWGKKILEWSRSPQEAAAIMIHLNNKYGVDGRDPNSYAGIFWVLGRCDRPWAPERAVFGTVRYMSSENTARKFSVKDYIRKYASGSQLAMAL